MAIDYVSKISRLGWRGLRKLWREIGTNATMGWEPGKAFEHLVLRSFELSGADVTWPYSVSIEDEVVEQIDGAIYIDSLTCLIECKDSDDRVNVEPIAKLRNQLLRRPAAAIGMVFTRSGFTEAALTLGQFLAPQTILLWTGPEIAHFLKYEDCRAGLRQKYRYCVETGMPDFDIRVGTPS